MNLQSVKNLRYEITRWILVGLTVLIVLFVLLALLRVGIVFWLYSSIETWVTVRLGLDYYAAQLVTTVLVSVVTLLLPSFAWYMLVGKRRAWGTVAMIGGQALIFLLVSTVGQDVYFDRQTGKPLRYYADTPTGRVFSFTPGFDPRYGIEYQPFTREVASATATRSKASNASQSESAGAAPRPTQTKSVTVDADRMWVDSGIHLSKGDVLTIAASGKWSNVKDAYFVGPNGTEGPYPGTLLKSANLAALVGKVGEVTFLVGERYSGHSPASGRLLLSINDVAGQFSDNPGAMTVEVSYGPN